MSPREAQLDDGLIDGLGGLAVFGVILVTAPEVTMTFWEAVQFVGGPVWSVMWGTVLAVGVTAVAIVATKRSPLLAAVPAVGLFAVFLPLLIDLSVPDWYPEWLHTRVLSGFSPLVYSLIGILATGAVWAWATQRQER